MKYLSRLRVLRTRSDTFSCATPQTLPTVGLRKKSSHSLLLYTNFGVCVCIWLLGMNYELTIGGGVTQRRLSVPYRCEPPLHIVCKPTICHVPPSTAARLQHIAVQNQTGDVRDPNICFSLMFSPSCQSLRVTSRLVLPHFSETAGSAAGVYPVIWLGGGPVFTALLLITEPGERATPTH